MEAHNEQAQAQKSLYRYTFRLYTDFPVSPAGQCRYRTEAQSYGAGGEPSGGALLPGFAYAGHQL